MSRTANPAADAARLALGTLSCYPTSPPRQVDRRVAGWAMALAPVVGALVAAPLWLLTELLVERWSPFLLACAWVAGLAVLTRAMHLDGLADTADGLGSGRSADRALEVMRKSDIGPFGVTAVVLVLLVQVAAASQLLLDHAGALLLAGAVVVSRSVLPLACLRGVPGARGDGLGAAVAGSVGPVQLGVAIAVTLACTLAVVAWGAPAAALTAPLGVLVGAGFCMWCVRRLGGITGDVLGACVEVTLAAALLAMASA